MTGERAGHVLGWLAEGGISGQSGNVSEQSPRKRHGAVELAIWGSAEHVGQQVRR